MTQIKIEEEPPEFQSWIADRDLNDKEKTLWNFHKWMRQNTSLKSGTIVDYRKYIAEMLDEHGELALTRAEIDSSHKRAAFNKFCEYKKSTSLAKTNATGEQ